MFLFPEIDVAGPRSTKMSFRFFYAKLLRGRRTSKSVSCTWDVDSHYEISLGMPDSHFGSDLTWSASDLTWDARFSFGAAQTSLGMSDSHKLERLRPHLGGSDAVFFFNTY